VAEDIIYGLLQIFLCLSFSPHTNINSSQANQTPMAEQATANVPSQVVGIKRERQDAFAKDNMVVQPSTATLEELRGEVDRNVDPEAAIGEARVCTQFKYCG
jgi:hypothetical protein